VFCVSKLGFFHACYQLLVVYHCVLDILGVGGCVHLMSVHILVCVCCTVDLLFLCGF